VKRKDVQRIADLGGMTVLDGVLAEHLRNEKNKEVGE
jgi:hypothetical protein